MTESVAVTVADRVELGVIQASHPKDVVERATEAADVLAKVIRSRKLSTNIKGREYVRCEGWTTLAAMLGCTPHEISVTEHDGTFTATVEMRRITDGMAISRASAECGTDVTMWANRSRNARRSMALTRATGKACRLAFSWIMALAGYEVTPAEEMPRDEDEKPKEPVSSPEAFDPVDGDGALHEPLEGRELVDLLTLVQKSGVDKAAFPAWYEQIIGRPYDKWVFVDDKAKLEAAAHLKLGSVPAKRGKK